MADPSVVHAITEKTTPALSAVGVAWRQTVDQGERGGSLVALSGSLVGSRRSKPGLAPEQLSDLMNLVIVEGRHLGPEALAENVADLFVLAFELGDVREGRGERQLFVDFVLRLLKFFPETVVGACRLIPEYASWRTVNLLYVGARKALQSGTEDFGEPALLQLLCERLESMYIEQLEKDRLVLAEHDDAAAADAGKDATVAEGGVSGISAPARAAKRPSVSLASKWAPTIGCSVDKHSGLGQKLAASMFPVAPRVDEEAQKKAVNWQQQQYRRLLSKLRAASDVVERKMCLKRWREIEPSHVPSVANRKYRKALLNESKQGEQRSTEEDRIICAANVLKCIEESIAGVAGAKTIKGARNQIHEIVVPYMGGGVMDPMLEAIYVDIVKKLKESGTFRPAIPLVDVSGSMGGLPMQVAIGLGILLSDLLPEPLKGRVLTFTAQPAWADVTGDTLFDKVRCVERLPWGMNTNFAAALKEILEFCKANEMSPDMVPETLFIFSDMQWDQADHSAAHLARTGAADDPIFSFGGQDIRAEFEAAGFRPPHIVFWNLRATGTPTFQADSCSPGMSLMSGFSQEVLKDYMEDGSLHSGTEVTPWEKLSEKLWKTRYDAVRRVCEELQEGMLKGYTFAPPPRKGDEDEEDGHPAAGGGGGGAE